MKRTRTTKVVLASGAAALALGAAACEVEEGTGGEGGLEEGGLEEGGLEEGGTEEGGL